VHRNKQNAIECISDIIKTEVLKYIESKLDQQVSGSRKKKVTASTIACPE